ncbi:hypothetical protein [Streptomyces sp. NPDC093149]|uniref:hypothetical protein n=1 Tax=Streptomyces sp. NPDC093149 TaxID=3366031 RepID=UPI0038119375
MPLALVGGPAARIQRGLARRLLGVGLPESASPRGGPLTFVHAVLTLPVNLTAVVVSGYFWLVVAINIGYPLRPDNDYSTSWGGPTLAGAWAVHAIGGGVTFLLLTPWVIRGFTALQARLVQGFLGSSAAGRGRAVALALGVAAVCAVLSIPVIHQL